MRITIVGMPASGKSYLSKAIADKLGIPHIQIDRYWFEAGGRRGSHDTPNVDEVRSRIREKVVAAIEEDSWVSDGTYSRLQPEIASKADTIIYLDIPLWRRLINHAERMLIGGRHSELSMLDEIVFFAEIIKRNVTRKPKLEQFLETYPDKTIVLHSRKEADQYLQRLT